MYKRQPTPLVGSVAESPLPGLLASIFRTYPVSSSCSNAWGCPSSIRSCISLGRRILWPATGHRRGIFLSHLVSSSQSELLAAQNSHRLPYLTLLDFKGNIRGTADPLFGPLPLGPTLSSSLVPFYPPLPNVSRPTADRTAFGSKALKDFPSARCVRTHEPLAAWSGR